MTYVAEMVCLKKKEEETLKKFIKKIISKYCRMKVGERRRDFMNTKIDEMS